MGACKQASTFSAASSLSHVLPSAVCLALIPRRTHCDRTLFFLVSVAASRAPTATAGPGPTKILGVVLLDVLQSGDHYNKQSSLFRV